MYLLALLFSLPVHAEGFLSASKILSRAGVVITPAQIADQDQVLPVVPPEPGTALYLLTPEGPRRLKMLRHAQRRKLDIQTCGEEARVRPWHQIEGRPAGLFVAAGHDLSKIKLQWFAANDESRPLIPTCAVYRPDYATTSLHVAAIPGLDQKVFYAEQKSAQKLRYDAAYRLTKPTENSEPTIDCQRPDLAYDKVGLVGADCRVLLESPVNCDGQGYNDGRFDRPVGMIVITEGAETERWLVFLAHGYEGDAYLGIRLTPQKPAAEDVDFYVYSGC